MNSRCIVCERPFGLVRVTVGMLWWARSYCSHTCAEDDIRMIEEDEKSKHLPPKPT